MTKIYLKKKAEENLQDTKNNENPQIFMDSTVYTVLLDNNLNIKDVINHTTEEISDDKIKEIAENILKNKGEENTKIGNLYYNYSYSLNKDNTSLVIIDNTNTKELLMQTLKTSIMIFIILEIVIVISSKQI